MFHVAQDVQNDSVNIDFLNFCDRGSKSKGYMYVPNHKGYIYIYVHMNINKNLNSQISKMY